ncbi:phosphopantetheine-binding protein [Bacillus sp. CECT 9360]|uniref:acyl carrier protein n=1 Tax=Bacillus sp. CECT 9360 TaxID=2845821 RepID=UPI001E29654D|nr:phosphopantetheine-binding protein [Bacillus sp. CECT 9360]CAH0346422.1 Acyl carrier protein [Bacillus sp. CECT 9360]
MNFEEFRLHISETSNIPLEKIENQSSFRDDLNIDSLQMVNLIVEISVKFGIEITSIQDNEDFQSVGKLYQAITREGF